MTSSTSKRRSSLFCECENCTVRWHEDRDGIGTIRCPACGSKNVDIYDQEDTDDDC